MFLAYKPAKLRGKKGIQGVVGSVNFQVVMSLKCRVGEYFKKRPKYQGENDGTCPEF